MKRAEAFQIGSCTFEGKALPDDIYDLGCFFDTLDCILLLKRGSHEIMVKNRFSVYFHGSGQAKGDNWHGPEQN
jgi:hypothetical protein